MASRSNPRPSSPPTQPVFWRHGQMFLSESQRYEHYRAYCELVGSPVLPFPDWRRESARIPELAIMGAAEHFA